MGALAALLCAACLQPALAQEPAPKEPSPREDGSAGTVVPLSELLPAKLNPIADPQWFGVFDRMGRSVGTASLSVARAKEGEAFLATLEVDYQVNGVGRIRLRETLRLGAELELLELTQSVREDDAKTPEVASWKRKGAAIEGRDARGSFSIEPKASPTAGVAHKLLLARHLRLSEKKDARARLSELGPRDEALREEWVRTREQAKTSDQPEGVLVEFAPDFGPKAGPSWRFLRTADALHVETAGWAGVTLRSAKDQADAKRARPLWPADSARAKVLEFMVAIAEGKDDAAAATIDWPALQKSVGDTAPPETFRKQVLGRILRASVELDLDDVERAAPGMTERELSPGRREVRLPREPTRFVLVKGKQGWRIVSLAG